jgi:hypothetical protein
MGKRWAEERKGLGMVPWGGDEAKEMMSPRGNNLALRRR